MLQYPQVCYSVILVTTILTFACRRLPPLRPVLLPPSNRPSAATQVLSHPGTCTSFAHLPCRSLQSDSS